MKDAWLQALASDKYVLIKGQFRSVCGYCALGILADIMDPSGWEQKWLERAARGSPQHNLENDIYNGKFFDQSKAIEITKLNDTFRRDEERRRVLIDYIEENIYVAGSLSRFF